MSLFWLLMAVFGTPLAPHSIDDIGGGPLMGGLTSDNLLGTDYLGRDMLSRILYGAKFSIGLALSAALLASLIGTLLALLAAVAGRWLEELLGRVNDALLVLPGKVLSLMIVAVFGSSLPMLILTAVFTYWRAHSVSRLPWPARCAAWITSGRHCCGAKAAGISPFTISCPTWCTRC